jgi:hypothetical protein
MPENRESASITRKTRISIPVNSWYNALSQAGRAR